MLKKITNLFFKREAPVIEEPKPETKTTVNVEISKWYKEDEPPVVHFRTDNINDFKDCIGTLCKRHLNYNKVNRKYEQDGSYKDTPVYIPEYQIKVTETHRYTNDVKKVSCSDCINRLKSNK